MSEPIEPLDAPVAPAIVGRRKMIPLWIKVFVWMFMIFGIITPIGLVMGILGIDMSLSLYGMSTMKPLSPIGFSILLLFGIKGVTSFGLWTEKDWAVNLAIADALIGIVICVLVIFLLEGSKLRLELAFLVPYLVKMIGIRTAWSEAGVGK